MTPDEANDHNSSVPDWNLLSFPLFRDGSLEQDYRSFEITECLNGDRINPPCYYSFQIMTPGGMGYTGGMDYFPIWFEGNGTAIVDIEPLIQNWIPIPTDPWVRVKISTEIVTNPTWYIPVRNEVVEFEILTVTMLDDSGSSNTFPGVFTNELTQTQFEVVQGGSPVLLRAFRRTRVVSGGSN